MWNNILVVFSPSHQGHASLKYAMNIAKGIDASMLRLLFVIPTARIAIPIPLPPQGTFSPIPVRDSPEYRDLIDIAATRLSEFRDICGKSDIESTGTTILGKRGYLVAEMATLCHLVVCEKRNDMHPMDRRYREISLGAISRAAHIPLLAVPPEYDEINVVQTLYDGTLRSSSSLGFSMHLAQILGVKLRVLLINGPEFRAEDMERRVQSILTEFLSHCEASVLVVKKAKRVIERFGSEKEVITAIDPGWYSNFMRFRLSRNQAVHMFEGPVALVP